MFLFAALIAFLSGTELHILRVAQCDVLLQPVPGPDGDAYAVKWVCK